MVFLVGLCKIFNMTLPLSPKQLEFIINSTAHWNLAHGSVRAGKTIASAFRFMQAANECPDSQIYIVGHTFDTAYRNVVKLIMESEELSIFRPFCTWSGKKLYYKDKKITVLGAKDEGAIGNFQGDTYSLVLCDEMTLYPQSIIEMINSRLSRVHSIGFATMNPKHPTHLLKQWIDKAEAGDKKYYSLHFTVEDNPYLGADYIQGLKESCSALFYKRNYLGLWCLAEGAVFDFFDRNMHVVKRPPRCAEYWIAGIDYGTVNSFACTLIGINTGKTTQTGICRWAEREYVWDSKKKGRQKTNAEYANDVASFLEDYDVKGIYVDPSAAAFKLELRKRGLKVIDADNDVENGINFMTSEMATGNLFICEECPNLIREIESYVWDSRSSEKGEDQPLKKDDHSIDSLRYAVYTHKIAAYRPYKDEGSNDYLRGRFNSQPRRF
jgi:PBSX family phage terminase large subunit